jgi:hypothetical protein
VIILPSLTPRARIIWLLSPVARMAVPMSVPKKQVEQYRDYSNHDNHKDEDRGVACADFPTPNVQ